MSINSHILDLTGNRRYSLVRQKDEWRTVRNERLRYDMDDQEKADIRLDVLNRITGTVHASLDTSEILQSITDTVVHTLGYTAAFMITKDGSEKFSRLKYLTVKMSLLSLMNKLPGFPDKELTFSADPELNGCFKSVLSGEIAIAEKLSTIASPYIGEKTCAAIQKLAGIRNVIALPVTIDERTIGVLFISSSGKRVTAEELQTLKYLKRSASIALKNARYHLDDARQLVRESEGLFCPVAETTFPLAS